MRQPNRLWRIVRGGSVGVVIAAPLAAQSTALIRGRVVDTERRPVASVEVTLIDGATGTTQSVRTNARGEYAIVIHAPIGNDTLTFRKVGYGTFTHLIAATDATVVDVPDAALPGGLNVLQPLIGSATRFQKVPSRGDVPSVGGAEMNSTNNGLFVAAPGDLDALAALIPGVHAVGDSAFSVLGAAPDQNRITVDGLDVDGARLPRDAISQAKVSITTYDPSRGNFAGAETQVTTRVGNDYFVARIRGQLIDPHLSWSDPDALTPAPRMPSASGYAAGPLVKQRLWYFAAFDASQRTVSTPSLLSASSGLLSQFGISGDTVALLGRTLATLGVPIAGDAIPGHTTTTSRTALANLNFRPNGVTTLTASVTGDWDRRDGLGRSPLAVSTATASNRASHVRYALSSSTYVHRILEDFRAGVSVSSSRNAPYLVLPGASVLVGTEFPASRTGLGTLGFGGGGGATDRSTGQDWEINNTLSWATANTQHQLKFTQFVRHQSTSTTPSGDAPGFYTYQSLDDLAHNAPSSFRRVVSAAGRHSSGTMTAFSLGDVWRPVPGVLEFQGGVRYDATAFAPAPSANPVIDSLFGVRTDVVPHDHGFSPRLGFSWSPGARRSGALPEGMIVIAPGTTLYAARGSRTPLDASGIAIAPPGSPITISGGIGAYRGVISPAVVGALNDETGLPGTTTYLSCIGASTPIPDWSANAAPPTTCADGTGSAFAASDPRVVVFDPAFKAPVTWRANVQVQGLHLGRWLLSPQFLGAEGIHSASWVDLNASRSPGFVLPSEGDRPVYADPASIDPATGLLAPVAGRLSSNFGRVTQLRSDGRYTAGEFLFPLVPSNPLFGTIPAYFVYTLNVGETRDRGFNATTAGDPFALTSYATDVPTHQFSVGATAIRAWWLTLGLRLDLFSGTPYTPIVAGDVNGDGVSGNDRAFVADPAAIADTALARQMALLLAHAPAGARRCLAGQIGTIARANSCTSPWQARLDLNLAFTPPASSSGSRVRILTTVLNAESALVRLFGLEDTPFGQSLTTTGVDPRLLYVTAFDPARRQFRYTVNQLFGEPTNFGASRRQLLPFELQLGVEYRFGYPPTAAPARSIGAFGSGKDTAATAAEVRSQLVRRYFGADPVASILTWGDSLGLTPDQRAGIEAAGRAWHGYVDSVVTPAVVFIMHRGKRLTSDELNVRMEPIARAARLVNSAMQTRAQSYLLPEQRDRLHTFSGAHR